MAPTEVKTELTRRTIWEAFRGLECPTCHALKRKHNAFCRICYQRLPGALKTRLWLRFGEGFEEAYRLSLLWFPTHPLRGEMEMRKRA